MASNYFSPENAWRHLFFIHGLTGDEFYSDGGMKLNIEQLVHMELKHSGYERIVFYDKKSRLHCHDDESYALLSVNGATRNSSAQPVSLIRSKKGLKAGKFGKKKQAAPEPEETEPPQEQTDSPWVEGAHSGLGIRRTKDGPLHLGVQENVVIIRQIDGYMYDSLIKTAVVINDPTDFLREFGNDPMHSLTAGFERLSTDNENIMVFIYTDEELGNLYQTIQPDADEKDINDIDITCPNATELRNMLAYCRIRNGLNLRFTDLNQTALALRRAMSLGEKPFRIKEVYSRLQAFGTQKRLTPDGCYDLLGVKKPVSADSQLSEMIGMTSLKEQLAQYRRGPSDPLSEMQYLTASRLQQDLPRPKKKDEMIHFVLTGNPGTGKTTVAKLIGQLFYEMGYLESGHVVETDRSELVSNHVGETAIFTRNKVMEAMGGVLFIDEAYTLKRDKNNSVDFGQESIDTLVKLMDQYKGKFIVVAAGYKREMDVFLQSNPGLPRRFRSLHIEDYTPDEMRRILEFTAGKDGFAFCEDLQQALPNFCDNWVNLAGEGWGNAGEAVNLVEAMGRSWSSDPKAVTVTDENGRSLRLLETRHLPENLARNLTPVEQMRAQSLRQLNEMTGLSGVKAQIEKLRLRMLSGDMQEPGHYVFSGNPGTGKTTVARRMGEILRNLGLLKRGHLVEFTAATLMGEVFSEDYNGNFDLAVQRAMDGVLFIDEAHQLASDTTGRGRSILNALVPFMENNCKGICVILAGYDDQMEDLMKHDPGIKSRVTDIIRFANYTGQELHGILLDMLRARGIDTTEEYRELSLRALTRYRELYGKSNDFGNARYVRQTYIPASLDAQTRRLITKYGEDFPKEEKKLLTAEDIPEDLVRLTKAPLSKPDTRSTMEKLDDLIGYDKIKEELRRLLKVAQFNRTNEIGVAGMPERLHWVLEGNPGTGKTTIAKLIGEVYRECGILPKGHTLKVTRADLVAGFEGQTAPKTRRCIEKAMGGVLFIDEAYTLTKVENGQGGFGAEAIGELVEAMDSLNGEFAVVAAGYPSDMEDFLKANSGLSSRMKTFVLEDYTPEELTKIFLLKCKSEKAQPDEELREKLPLFFGNMKKRESTFRDWGNGREAENLLRNMLHQWMEAPVYTESEDGTKLRLLTTAHIPESHKRYLKGKPASSKKEESPIDAIRKLIGFDEVKVKLQELLDLGRISKEQEMDDLLSGLTLHWVLRGNPGTGKTTVAELIGKVYKEMGLLSRGHTVKVTRADLVAGYEGQTPIKTQKCIERAIGGVLFIDEAYTLKRASGQGSVDFGQEAIDTLLEQMSARNGEFAVIVAGYPREMDIFLNSNPGFTSRFGEDFMLADYNADELTRIFRLKCKGAGFQIDEDLSDVLEPMFDRMIRARLKGWANGREAENLEKSMRKFWTRDSIIRVSEDGEKQRFYALKHLPEKYRRYLPSAQDPAEGNQAASAPGSSVPSHSSGSYPPPASKGLCIPHAHIPAPVSDYQYDRDFMRQVSGLVLIRAASSQGHGFGSGSFITKDGYILTCNHVIDGMEDIQVRMKLPQGEDVQTIWEAADVVWADSHVDAAILKIRHGSYPALPLRPLSNKIQIGESIYLWGYPFGAKLSDDLNELQPSLFQGYVSSIQVKGGLDRVNTNMEAKRGCSGGPVFSKKDGSILGILCGSQTEGGNGLVEEINYVLPVRYIWEQVIGKPEDPAK